MEEQYGDTDVLIVSACRTPIGQFCGGLSSLSAHELGGQAIAGCLARAKDQLATEHSVEELASRLQEVIMGQVFTAGCGQNPARRAAVAGGIPFSVPAWGVNMVCASGLKSVCQSAQTVKLEGGMAIAGGQESMSRCPHITPNGCSLRRGGGGGNGNSLPVFGDFRLVDSLLVDGLEDAFGGIHMGMTAELIAKKCSISRQQQDEFAAASQSKCKNAMETGNFAHEIMPITVTTSQKPPTSKTISVDESPRPDTSMEGLSRLKPAFLTDGTGTVTAGNASTLSDGAAALLLCRADTARQLGVKCSLGRIVGWNQSGCAPELMGLGPIDAVLGLLKKLSWSMDDVDMFELNEAFAAQSIAVTTELAVPASRTNISGGAIALGHPLGCSGTRILVTLLHNLHRVAHTTARMSTNGFGDSENAEQVEEKRRKRYRGVAALCVGGGMGLAIAVEILLSQLNLAECPVFHS